MESETNNELSHECLNDGNCAPTFYITLRKNILIKEGETREFFSFNSVSPGEKHWYAIHHTNFGGKIPKESENTYSIPK